jgi:hypothetical protein
MSFSRALLVGSAAALALAGAAHADMSGLVGNTIQITGANNLNVKIQLHADGTYQTTSPQGVVKGTWKADGDKLCYTQTDPAPPAGRPNPFCAQGMDGKKVGDTWTVPGQGGAPGMNGSVVAGQ